MSELLSRFSGGELIAVLSIGGGLVASLIAWAGVMWVEVRKAETAAAL